MNTILLVEPDKVLGKAYQQALQGVGYKVIVRSQAQQAILSVDKQSPKLIISELQLAEHNGVEFLYELRSYPDWKDIPVIILTNIPPGDTGLSDDIQRQLNIAKYCYKSSTSMSELISLVQSLLPKHGSKEES